MSVQYIQIQSMLGRGFNQSQVADHLGITRQAVSDCLKKSPIRKAKQIAKARHKYVKARMEFDLAIAELDAVLDVEAAVNLALKAIT